MKKNTLRTTPKRVNSKNKKKKETAKKRGARSGTDTWERSLPKAKNDQSKERQNSLRGVLYEKRDLCGVSEKKARL